MENLKLVLESLLFVAGRPLSLQDLAKFSESSEEEVRKNLLELQENSRHSGIMLVTNGEKWQLATHPSSTSQVKLFLQSDLKEALSDASLEVLAVIAYVGPVSRAQVDAIRGVNSQYSVRQLLMRGLVEKVSEGRQAKYRATTDFLKHLGLSSLEELPDYQAVGDKIRSFETAVSKPDPLAPESNQESSVTLPAQESF